MNNFYWRTCLLGLHRQEGGGGDKERGEMIGGNKEITSWGILVGKGSQGTFVNGINFFFGKSEFKMGFYFLILAFNVIIQLLTFQEIFITFLFTVYATLLHWYTSRK